MRIIYFFLVLLFTSGVTSPAWASYGDEDGYGWGDWEDVNEDGDANIWDFLQAIFDDFQQGDEGIMQYEFNEDGTVDENFYPYEEVLEDPSILPLDWDELSMGDFVEELEYSLDNEDFQDNMNDQWDIHNNDKLSAANWLNEQHINGNYPYHVEPASGVNNTILIYLQDGTFITFDLNSLQAPPGGWHLTENGHSAGGGTTSEYSFPPLIMPDEPDFSTQPETPYNIFEPIWALWEEANNDPGIVIPSTPPDPAYIPVQTVVPSYTVKMDAVYNGIRAYVTPGGTPITLPVGAKVLFLKGVNNVFFPNGALYEFELPNGTKYASAHANLNQFTGQIAQDIIFKGYYKVVNGTLDYSQPYIVTEAYPIPDDGEKIKVNRIQSMKDLDGTCKLVRTIVEYEKAATVPATLQNGTPVKVNQRIVEEIPLEEYLPEEKSIDCNELAEVDAPNLGSGMTLEKYLEVRGKGLAAFIKHQTKYKPTIHFYDAVTKKVKYRLDKTGIIVPQNSYDIDFMEYFEDDNMDESSGPIQIVATIQNDQWVYDVKFNPNAELDGASLPVHPIVSPVREQVEAVIRKHADEEVQYLKKIGALGTPESVATENGEQFSKQSMDLLKSIAAIYDVGLNIVTEGRMPEAVWDQGRRSATQDIPVKAKYRASPFHLPSAMGGCTDQLIDDITGPVQLANTGLEFLRHPRATFQSVWDGVRTLNKDKIRQFVTSATGIDNYTAGGDRAVYQGGYHAMQAAMILVVGLESLLDGVKSIKKGGADISDYQLFLPDGAQGNSVSNALKNALDNEKTIRNIDNEKLVMKNVENGQDQIVVAAREGNGTELYSGVANYNLDDFGEDVLKKAAPDDVIDLAEDATLNTYYKNQPQKFKDGKDFENNVNNDPTHTSKVQTASGINLTGYTKIEQVQIKFANGSYFVVDNMWYKSKIVNGQTRFDVVLNESKLSPDAPFTVKQTTFLQGLSNNPPITNFELRSAKFSGSTPSLVQGAKLDVQAYVKTVSNGTSGIGNYTITKIP